VVKIIYNGGGKMASFVQVQFDRTKPEVEIYAPNYTTQEILNVITIQANEPLSTYQDFYIEDSYGTIHEYTFTQSEPDVYTGRIILNNLPFGILKLYAKVRDEVDNESNLVMASIELKESIQLVDMTESHKERAISLSVETRQIDDDTHNMDIETSKRTRLIEPADRVRTILAKENEIDIDSK
jgi:hypothetical protein